MGSVSDQKPSEPMSDETIASIVKMVEAAEVFAASFDVQTSVAVRMLLKSWQITARMQAGKSFADSLAGMLPSRIQ